MNGEASLVYEIWETVREYVPASRRTDVAISLFRSFEEFGFESKDLAHLIDEDDNLTAAFKAVFGSDDEEDEEEYDPYG